MLGAGIAARTLYVDGVKSAGWLAKIGLVAAGLLAYAGAVLWVRGCGTLALVRGYSRWWGLLGFLGIIGSLIIALFPAKPSPHLNAEQHSQA